MRVTASKSALLHRCGWWARDEAEWVQQESPEASRGTRLHRAAEEYIRSLQSKATIGPESDALEHDDLLAWSKIAAWIDINISAAWRPEVPYAYDVERDTGRELPSNGQRDYTAATDDEIAGTCDVVDVEGGRIYDFKMAAASAGARSQLETLALMVARAHGLSRVTCTAVYVTEEGVREDTFSLDEWGLDEVASEIQDSIGGISTAEPVSGPHCSDLYCPARLTCPETAQAVEQVIPASALVPAFKMALRPLNEAHAAWMLHRLPLIEEAVEAAKEAIKDYARNNGGSLNLGDGQVYRESEYTRQYDDVVKLKALARRLGASDADIASCTKGTVIKSWRKGKAKGRAA